MLKKGSDVSIRLLLELQTASRKGFVDWLARMFITG